MVIGVLSQKGGVGKTTISTNIACMLAANKHKTMLIDADPQTSSMKFRAIRPDSAPQFSAVTILEPVIHKDIKELNYDYIVVDSGGRDLRVTRSAMRACDVIIVPMLTSQYDIWSSIETFEILKEIRDIKDVSVVVVLNQLISNTLLSKDILGLVQELSEEHDFDIMNTKLYSRIAYKESSLTGLAVTELEGVKYKKAAKEMEDFYYELLRDLMGIKGI